MAESSPDPAYEVRCIGVGLPLVPLPQLILVGCPECRSAWDPDIDTRTVPEHMVPGPFDA